MTTHRYAISLLALAISVGVSHSYAAERATSYTYHPSGTNGAGQMATMNGPRTDVSDVSSYSYDNKGNLASVTNALGHVTQYSDYNGRGLAGKVTDANGVETLLEYHVRGWLTKTTVKDPGGNTALDAVTSFTYDAVGQITRITLPDASYLDFEYDAAQRLVAIQNNLNERIEYTLDAAGNRTKEDVKNSSGVIVKTQTRVFDELSRLMRDVGANNQTTQVGYDKNDNATQITDAKLNPTGQAYDALNRLVTQTDPDNNTINYTYDSQDRIKTVTDQRGLVTTYTYNGHGDLLSIDSPDTSMTTYEYDAAGNRTKQTDARGVVVNYSYDALNRLIAISYPASAAENVTYTYDDTANGNDGIGRLTKIDDASGHTSFKYDHRNNLIEKTTVIESRTYTLLYSYDLANNLTQITYPSGRLVNYSRDTAGRINAVTTQADAGATVDPVISAVTYAPFGPMTTYTYGNGMTHSVSYDQDYRITDIEAQGSAAVLDLNYGYDPNSNITSLVDQKTSAESQLFDYDKLNRLTDADGSYGELEFEYDAVSNRTKKVTTEGANTTTDTYSYSSTSNRLNQVASDDGTTIANRTLQYDANGNIITDTKTDGTVHSLAYNNANRYSILTKNSTATAVYEYNALGQRVAKTSQNPTQDEHYHYDSAGKLLAATKPTDGTPIREYIYLDHLKVSLHSASSTPIQEVISLSTQKTVNTDIWDLDLTFNITNKTCRLVENKNGQPHSDITLTGVVAEGGWDDYVHNGIRYLSVESTGYCGLSVNPSQGTVSAEAYATVWPVAATQYMITSALGGIETTGGTLTTVTYLHNDHLGRPQVATDQNQIVVWESRQKPFGEAEITTNTLDNDTRFPGQYLDKESGLHYNYFRDYDPTIGRYIQSDPIGLAGGINTYAYVGGNPTTYIDPFGLLRWKGDFHARGLVGGVGSIWMEFILTSDCVDGQEAKVTIQAVGPAGGVGFKASESRGNISFEDHRDTIQPDVFNGGFGALQLGILVGKFGGSIGKVRLGDAYSREGGDLRGLDVGATLTLGSSTVTNVEVSSCGCE